LYEKHGAVASNGHMFFYSNNPESWYNRIKSAQQRFDDTD